MKLCMIGAGSTYTPDFIDAYIKLSDELPFDNITLMDINKKRLDILGGLVKRMVKHVGLNPEVITTIDSKEAIKGSDFVFTTFRIGGQKHRIIDEKNAMKYGMVHNETTGPAGFSYALRQVPVAVNYARMVEKYAPDAFLVNVSNPSGIMTEAQIRYSNVKVFGLCNDPGLIWDYLANTLKVNRDRIKIEYFGFNHFAYVKRIWLDGKLITKEAIKKIAAAMRRFKQGSWVHGGVDETERWFLKSINPEVVELYGMYLQPYLRFYYHQNRILEEEKKQTETRAQTVTRIENELLEMYADPNLKVKPKELDRRGGGGYSLSALKTMAAIWNDENSIHIVNCRNNGTIQGLDDDASVEVSVVANKAGVFPLTIGKIPMEVLPKLQVVKGYETLTAKAAIEGSKELALKALCLHPLVPSYEVAKAFLDDTLRTHKDFLPNFNK